MSVIIPTYDRPKFLIEAIASVNDQTYSNLELIVVDDHSPQPVAPIIEDLDLDGIQSVCCKRHEKNRGANAARNTGIRAANGDLLAFLDDDDRWVPKTVEREVQTLRRGDSNVGLVTAGMRIVDEQGAQIGLTIPEVSPEQHAIDALVNGVNIGSFSRIMVRRDLVEKAGLPDERFPCWQDWEWQFRLARHCRFDSVREPLVVRRVSSKDQISDIYEDRKRIAYPLLREKHRDTAAMRGVSALYKFEAELALTLGASALAKGYYATALRYLLRACRYNPSNPEIYLYLGLTLGGPFIYRSLLQLKRRFFGHIPNV